MSLQPNSNQDAAPSIQKARPLNSRPSPLLPITDWPARAAQAGYSVSKLARICGTSPRSLQRFFKDHFPCPPKQWLRRLRLTRALQLLRQGLLPKEFVADLGYRDLRRFCEDFSDAFGVPPTLWHLLPDPNPETSFAEYPKLCRPSAAFTLHASDRS